MEEKSWEEDFRLSKHVVPVEYNLQLHPHLENGTFSGSVHITLNVTAPCDHIRIHQKGLNIEHSTLLGVGEAQNFVSSSFEYAKNEFWVMLLNQTINIGIYSLKLDFNGSLTNDIVGFYRSTYKDIVSSEDRLIATTKFEPTYARRAFPCFDEPNFKAKFNISVVHPSQGNYFALSNMNQVGSVPDSPKPGLTTAKFAETVPMSTYLACFIVSDFDHLPPAKSKHGFDVSVYARNGQTQKMEYALRVAAATIDYYIDYFAIDYPLPKLDLIAIPDFVSGAMENWGLITYRETSVLYDSNFTSTAQKLQVTLTTCHELAHMWFGDLVTMKWWDDLWLNEGFATFISFKGAAQYHPDWDMDTIFLVHSLCPVMTIDSHVSSHPIIQHVAHPDQITEIFDSISYKKGSSVIRMLEGFMGNENFRQGVVSYLKTFKYDNAETSDLWHHLQGYGQGVNISRVMDTWTRQMGLPLLTVTRSGDTLTVSQQRFTTDPNSTYDHNTSPYKYKWDVPVTVITSENKQPALNWLLMENSSINIPIGNAQWYKLNWHFMNFYRVKYPMEDWIALKNVLLKDISALDAADRTNVLDDVFALAESADVDYSVALDVASFLSVESHYVVWQIARSHLMSLAGRLIYTEVYSSYRKYLKKLIAPHYNDSYWDFQSDSSMLERLHKIQMITLGCRVGVSACLNKAKQLFTSWLQNNSQKPHVEVRSIVYSYGIAETGEEEWDKVWDLYLAEHDPQEKSRLRVSLTQGREPWILARLIERAKNEDYVRSQDFFGVIEDIAANPNGNALVWDWIRSNWQYLVDRFTLNNRQFGRLLPNVVGGYSTKVKLNEVTSFLLQYPEEGAGSGGRRSSVEAIKINIQWLEKHLPTLSAWLNTV